MRVTLDSFRPSSQLMKNSQRQNRNQHSETTCLLISNVRALLRTLKNDRKTREMKQNEKSQTLSSNESESSFKKARRSRVKLSSKTFVTDSCFENDDEEKNFDDVAITRSATSQKKQQLRISKMSDRQSRIVFEFQTTWQLHRESMQDSLRRSKETRRETDDSENHDDEDDDEEEDEENRKTLNKNDAINASNESSDEALRSLSEVHSNKSTLKLQTLLTARRRVWSRTERLDNEWSRAHCSTCTCSSSSTSQSSCL